MHDVNRVLCFLCLPFVLLFGACQQMSFGGGGNIGVRDHADAVTNLGQVDPSYRGYFSAQHGRNYSIADQRKAFFAAVQTSRTPVNQDARHMGRNEAPAKKTVTRKKTVQRKTSSAKKKAPAKKKAATKKTTTKKTTTRKRR